MEEDKASCLNAIEKLDTQSSGCYVTGIKDCQQYENRTKRELCITSQKLSSAVCDNENVKTKKTQLIDMCTASKGWEQKVLPNY